MTNFDPVSIKDIHKVTYDILKQSKSFGVFPTPVDKIVQFAELHVDNTTGLHDIPNHYISKKIDSITRIMSKVFGALDRKKIIYLNPDILDVKKRFVKLHETGHHSMPWQRATFDYVEDQKTLSPDVLEIFEAEANFYASAVLFQMEIFKDIAGSLPLELKSARWLAKHFGASVHAATRRYVETIGKRCSLLVLNRDGEFRSRLLLRDYFQSPSFTKEFGTIDMPGVFDVGWPFVRDFMTGKIAIDYLQEITIETGGEYN